MAWKSVFACNFCFLSSFSKEPVVEKKKALLAHGVYPTPRASVLPELGFLLLRGILREITLLFWLLLILGWGGRMLIVANETY